MTEPGTHATTEAAHSDWQHGDCQQGAPVASLGTWSHDLRSDRITGSADVMALFGGGPESLNTFTQLLDAVHPDDRAWVRTRLAEVFGSRQDSFQIEYRVAVPGQPLRHILALGRITRDAAGQAVRVDGTAQDVTGQRTHVWFLHSLDRVNRSLQGARQPEATLRAALDTLLEIFGCDRAWLLRPCVPEAAAWEVVTESTRPEYPGALALGHPVPMDPEMARVFAAVRAVPGPVCFGPGAEQPLPGAAAELFHIQSGIGMALHPHQSAPLMLGLHQCSWPRVWTAEERRLLEAVGHRVADALDVTLALQAARNSERRLLEAETIAHIGHVECDHVAGTATLSAEACRLFGLSTASLALAQWLQVWNERLHPEDRARVLAAAAAAERACQGHELDYRVVDPDGAVRWLHCRVQVDRDAQDRPRRQFHVVQDLTALRTAELEADNHAALFRTFVDHATDAMFMMEFGGAILDVNHQACVSLGMTREQLIGQPPGAIDPEISAERLATIGSRIARGEVVSFESRHQRRDGASFPVEVRIRPFSRNGKTLAVALVRDITERKRAEQAEAESHGLLRAVVESSADAIFVKDLEGRYRMINHAGARFIGRGVDEIVGHTDRELFSADTVEAVLEADRQVLTSGQPRISEETATAAGVTRTYSAIKTVHRDTQGRAIGLIGISRDVTEVKRLEEQFRQAQKMEAVGRLAGGVAHDFNNLLTVINGYSEVLIQRLAPTDPCHDPVTEIQRAGGRAARLIRQLLAFSRRQVLQPRVVGLNGLLQDLSRLLQRLIGEDIEIELQPAPDLGLVRIDPGQFEHAIINLAVNARDAMPGGGRLLICTAAVELTAAQVLHQPGVAPGPFIEVRVADTGHGMDANTRARIFEPFFTTKGPGQGTGLGLAMVYGFIRQSGGHIEVDSEPGRGTTLRLYLPVAISLVGDTAPAAVAAPGRGGNETVLLVEDEDAVRALARSVLRAKGYRVLDARNGPEAIAVSQEHRHDIDLLLTDLVMPRMNGRHLADTLCRARPGLRVLFMSGYADEALIPDRGPVSQDLLQKPFTPDQLAARVRATLDRARPLA